MTSYTYIPHAQNEHLSASPALEITSSEHGYEQLSYETEVYANNLQ